MSLTASTPQLLVLGADGATLELLREWLGADGYAVTSEPDDPAQRYALVLVDVPFPRQGPSAPLQRVARGDTPVLALSATFHSTVERSGEVARALGVAGVLPKPIRREALLDAVRSLARPTAPQ